MMRDGRPETINERESKKVLKKRPRKPSLSIGPEYVSADRHSTYQRETSSSYRLPKLPKAKIESTRPMSRMLTNALHVLDEKESCRPSTVHENAKVVVQKSMISNLLRDVRASSNQSEFRLKKVVTPLPITLLDDLQRATSGNIYPISIQVPPIPFGYLAFQPFSWNSAHSIDLRLWSNVVNDESLLLLMEANPYCVSLDLRGCCEVTDAGIGQVACVCSGLEILKIAGCCNISDVGVERVLEVCGESIVELDCSRYYHVESFNCRDCDKQFSSYDAPISSSLGSSEKPFSSSGSLVLDKASYRAVARYCPNIRIVNFSHQGIDSSLDRIVKMCPNISSIDLTGCYQIGNYCMKSIGERCSSSLGYLSLEGCSVIDDEGLCGAIEKSHHLKQLNLSGLSKVTDAGIRGFLETKVFWGYRQHAGFGHLKSMQLRNCVSLTDVSLSWIASGCPNLESLDLTECINLKDFGLRAVSTMSCLRQLNISKCTLLTDQGLLLIAGEQEKKSTKILGRLSHVNLSYLNISDRGLIPMIEILGEKNGGSLRSIHLEGVEQMTDGFLRVLALSAGHKLHHVSISNCENITAGGIGAIGQRCRYIRSFVADNCSSLGNDVLESLSHLKHIEHLSIFKATRISSVAAVPNWKLRHLNLNGIPALVDLDVFELVVRCQELRHLDISNCTLLTDTLLEKLLLSDCIPPDIETINAYGCLAISNALFLRMVAHQCTKQLVTEFVETESFRGCCRNSKTLHYFHQHHVRKHLQEIEDASLVLQCFSRVAAAKDLTTRLRHERKYRRERAATKIQKIIRGSAGRWFAYMLRKQFTDFAVLFQYMWRKHFLRQRTVRAVLYWKNRLIRNVFRGWHHATKQSIIEKRAALEEERRKKAAGFWIGKTHTSVIKRWKEYTANSKWSKVRYPKADAFRKKIVFSAAFPPWKSAAEESLRRRMTMSKIFLNCIPLELRNSELGQIKTGLSYNYFVKSQSAKYFDLLRAVVAIATENLQVAVNHHLRSFFSVRALEDGRKHFGFGGKMFYSWNDHTKASVAIREIQRDLTEETIELRKQLAIVKIAKNAARRLRERKLSRAALLFSCKREMQQGFAGWKQRIADIKSNREKINRALIYMRHAVVFKQFNAWVQLVQRTKSNQDKLAIAMKRFKHRNLLNVFNCWRLVAKSVAEFRAKSLLKLQHRVAFQVFEDLKKLVEHHKAKRQVQKEKWLNFNSYAVRIQARWRGIHGRENIEEIRIITQFMTIRIQSYVRRFLAYKARSRAIRLRNLTDYVRLEKELDLMAVEDEDGRAMTVEYRAAQTLQLRFRARKSRDLYYYARRERAKQRELQRRANITVQGLEHIKNEQERKEEEEGMVEKVAAIQKMIRGYLQRLWYKQQWMEDFLAKTLIKIQRAYRGRLGRQRYSATKRHKVCVCATRKQQSTNSKILRSMLLKNRKQQAMAIAPLDYFGLHPDSFTLDFKKLEKELETDFLFWKRHMTARLEAFRHGGLKRQKRAAIENAFHERIRKETEVVKGNCVRIVSPFSPHRGKTGYILNIRSSSSLPGGKQAVVKLDGAEKIIFMALLTPTTAHSESIDTMMRIDSLKKDFSSSKVTLQHVQNNSNTIISFAEKLALDLRETKAALMVQRNFRGKKMRAYFKAEYAKQQEIDTVKKEKLLKILGRLRLDNARTGRILVASGLVWPRHIPELPESPFSLEVWWHNRKVQKEYIKFQKDRLKNVQADRIARLSAVKKLRNDDFGDDGFDDEMNLDKQFSIKKTNQHVAAQGYEPSFISPLGLDEEADKVQIQMRWRSRNLPKVKLWRFMNTATDNVFAPLAEKLDSKAAVLLGDEKPKRWVGKTLKFLAKIIGGPDWRRDPTDRLTWIGNYTFEQFQNSKHVNLDGIGYFHGTWNENGSPDGFGVIELPDGGNAKKKMLSKLWSLDDPTSLRANEKSVRRIRAPVLKKEANAEESYISEEEDFATDTEDEGEQVVAETMDATSSDASIEFANSNNELGSTSPALYDMILGNVKEGKLFGVVKIFFDNGDTYVGPYLQETFDWLASHDVVQTVKSELENTEVNLCTQEELDDFSNEPIQITASILTMDDICQLDEEVFNDEYESHGIWTSNGVTYEGRTVTNHFIPGQCQGLLRITWTNGEKYFGHMSRGMRNGPGIMDYLNGDKYCGRWSHGIPHGLGCYTWASRCSFLGYFDMGKKSGQGRQTFKNGAKYSGHYLENRFHGHGHLEDDKGNVYQGAFEFGKFHGEGVMQFSDGSVYTGSWRNGLRWTANGEVGQLVDAQGNTYKVPFVEDEMDGCGSFIKATVNRFSIEQFGVWQKDQLLHWTSVGINAESTDEFCSRFEQYVDYKGPFAMIVAQLLPELPSGVDPEDRRVEQHIDGVLRRAGPLVGSRVLKKCDETIQQYLPIIEDLKADSLRTSKLCAIQHDLVVRAQKQVETRKYSLQILEEEVQLFECEVNTFWKLEEHHSKKRAFKLALYKLKRFAREEWLACIRASYTPLLWDHLWNGICKIILPELDETPKHDPKFVHLLCNNSKVNAENGVKSGLLRNYQVRLLDEFMHDFDVYSRCKASLMIKDVSKQVHRREMKNDNHELTQVCALAFPLVDLLVGAYEYIKAAQNIVETVESLLKSRENLEHAKYSLQLAEKEQLIEVQTHYELEKEKTLKLVELQEQKEALVSAEQVNDQAKELTRRAREAESMYQLTHKFTFKVERDEDPIFPWISREDEFILDNCCDCIDDMMKLLSDVESDIWDCLFTVKELVVGQCRYENQHQAIEDDTRYVPPEIRDIVGDLCNQVAGFGRAELQVVDLLDEMMMEIGGGDTYLNEVMEDIISKSILAFEFRDKAERRDLEFKGMRVSVKCEKLDPRTKKKREIVQFGVCLETYDYRLPVYASPEPGTGLIYCDSSTDVFGFEDTCCFLKEIHAGDFLILPCGNDAYEERVVTGVLYDYQLVVDMPFSNACITDEWTRNWGFRKPNKVITYDDVEMINVKYDNGTEEQLVDLRRVTGLVEDEEEMIEDILEVFQEFTDDETGAVYWFNKVTAETTWIEPKSSRLIWIEYEDEGTGHKYWHNEYTNESSWTNPIK